MLKKFINRPVLATVVSIILVILGIVGMTSLPVTKFPEIAPPSVVVRCTYPGANAETVARAVAPVLETAINGVENMTYITSTSGNGTLTITIYFKLGTNPDQDAVNVQNNISQATSQLPTAVNTMGIKVLKSQPSQLMLVNLYSDSKDYDATFLQNYASINVTPVLQRVSGVGEVNVYGSRDYSMRVWLNPRQLAAYGITAEQVSTAISDQNLEASPGYLGENTHNSIQYTLKYSGKFQTPEQYENIVIKAKNDGSMVRLKDVARVEFGAYNYDVLSTYNGHPSITFAVYQIAGSNANEIEINLQQQLKKLSKDFPQGVHYAIPYSAKKSLDESIHQVEHTLLEAFILVFLVVFLFLQDFRSTLIPAIAVPVAIIGTFFFMEVFGFSINLLTLFGLVLAIGIVVDDAIVVIEAVHAKMEDKGYSARPATASAMSEISGAIISITLVMAAVFLPVGFLQGPTGVFYRQFAYTLAIAIIISAINALTLSPALCGLFLKNKHEKAVAKSERKHSFEFSPGKKFFEWFNRGFDKFTQGYQNVIRYLIGHKAISIGALIIFFALLIAAFKYTPSSFVPDEDQGFIIGVVNLPAGSSMERTIAVMKTAQDTLHKMSFIKNIVGLHGVDILGGGVISSSSGALMIELKDLDDRGQIKDINQILGTVKTRLSNIKEASFNVVSMPTIPGFGGFSGLQFVLQDKSAGSFTKFESVSNAFLKALNMRPEIAMAFTSYQANYPQYEVKIDVDKAKQLGVSVSDIFSNLSDYFGSSQASDFNRFGKYFRVIMLADSSFRRDSTAFNNIYVANTAGSMVPVLAVASIHKVNGPIVINHFNLFNSISINAMAKPGFSSGQAIKAIEETAEKELPSQFSYDWSGITREEVNTSGQSIYVFALCLLFVYFILSAQYESYLLPISVMLSIIPGIFGVFVGIKLAGQTNNIYVQIALIMLIGLLAKNAILIVEFAQQRRKMGMSIKNAAIAGAQARLRPILMTSLAFIVGMIPLVRTTGGSAIGNHSIGAAAIGGMLLGVIMGIFIIPVLYCIFEGLQEKITGPAKNIVDVEIPKD